MNQWRALRLTLPSRPHSLLLPPQPRTPPPRPSAPDPTRTIIHPPHRISTSSSRSPFCIIVSALARNTFDTRRAVTLLYGLQVASANARNLNHAPSASYLVTETTITSAGVEIAPDEERFGELAYQECLKALSLNDDGNRGRGDTANQQAA